MSDELLDKIEAIDYWQEHFANRTFLKALRVVVELHQPDQSGLCEWCTCRDCTHMVSYPCKTIQKIEQELK